MWFFDSLGVFGICLFYVLFLEEFGLDEESYELEVMVVVEVFDLNGMNDLIEVWALDFLINIVVIGSIGLGNFLGSVLDVVIKMFYFLIEGGKVYFVDV